MRKIVLILTPQTGSEPMLAFRSTKDTLDQLNLWYPKNLLRQPSEVRMMGSRHQDLTEAQQKSLVRILTLIPEQDLIGYVVDIQVNGVVVASWDFRKPN
jgi:hypothetical protein